MFSPKSPRKIESENKRKISLEDQSGKTKLQHMQNVDSHGCIDYLVYLIPNPLIF